MPFFAPLPGTTRTQGRATREQQYQRSYRYGIGLLCTGALLNWLGFAQHYLEPIRYIGVVCVLAGAFCICSAMCRWLGKPTLGCGQQNTQEVTGPNHEVAIFAVPMYRPTEDGEHPPTLMKPPEYDLVAGPCPPSYEEAIQLNPAYLPNTVQTDSLTGALSVTGVQDSRISSTERAETMEDTPSNTSSSQNQLSNNNDDNNNLPPPYESLGPPVVPPPAPIHNSNENQLNQQHFHWNR